MTRRSLVASAVTAAFLLSGLLWTRPAEAQCLDRTACKEIKAELAQHLPDLRAAKREIRKARRILKSLEPGSDRWLAKRAELKDLKKGFRKLKRELRALKQDLRHQGCSAC